MTLYRDEHGLLQHMPYRKARSHQERIPWISHHPLDVKRGTFLGEMSRLATLSSTHTAYANAMKGLAALYIARGYPQDLVYSWLKDNFTKRWDARLNEVQNRPDADDVLVLKSVYNTAWNFFSAKEVGDTLFDNWRGWFTNADAGLFSLKHQMYSGSHGGLEDVDPELCSAVTTSEGLRYLPDIRKLDIMNRRMIVSRKRTRNLFDLTSLWKKAVITKMESHVQAQPISDIEMDDSSSSSDSSEQQDVGWLFDTMSYRP
jgi:hypothetical protein